MNEIDSDEEENGNEDKNEMTEPIDSMWAEKA